MTEGEFHGKKVLITGAGGGLGATFVETFEKRGADLILCDQSADLLAGFSWPTYGFDLLDRASITETAQAILAREGTPDIVINNAGWTRAETMATTGTDEIEAEIRLNLTGVVTFANLLLAGMARRGSGALVFISSVNALVHVGNPSYSAAKAGINAFSRAVAVEYGRKGIRSNVVCPGSIKTPAWAHRLQKDPQIMDQLKRIYPLERIVEAREVAETVAFLASDRASGITGTVLPVDCGLTAGYLPFIDDILGGT